MTKAKIPVRVQKLVNICRSGKTVCLRFKQSDVGAERVYWLEPGGRPAGENAVKKAIELGLLVPAGDSLFADGDSQTYRAAQ